MCKILFTTAHYFFGITKVMFDVTIEAHMIKNKVNVEMI
jgi:hypothetical protein